MANVNPPNLAKAVYANPNLSPAPVIAIVAVLVVEPAILPPKLVNPDR
jgi:hypothetical protein